jgi:hypothetical protein
MGHLNTPLSSLRFVGFAWAWAKKARNLRTSDNMRTLFFLGSIAGIVYGTRHFFNYLSKQRKSRPARRRANTTHVRRRRTAQQVSPRRVSKASPRSVG